VYNYAEVETEGASTEAVFAQSVGGGGGNGAIAGSFNAQLLPSTPAVGVSVGGSGGAAGAGGAVTVNNYATGTIITNGANSTAIFAQSVGGGGGNGGYAMTVSASIVGSVGVAVGGSGGAAGNGGAVTVSNAGAIEMNGKNSLGIMAQSVGGGGGVASDALGVAVVPVMIGGQTGANGVGGTVMVTNTGSIVISGNNSIGIFAQSVGGGGGMVKPGGGATSVVTESGGTGNGGTVTIDNTAGMIEVTGDNSIAIYSQSVGGGGGAVGLDADPPGQVGAFLFSGSAGGVGAALATITNQTGSLIATGVNSIALVGQSTAPGGNGDITVNIFNPSATTMSLIEGGSGQGAGVVILDGNNNTLNNAGKITTILGINGYAIRATDGNDAVNNAGWIVGSVDLGTGTNSIDNKPYNPTSATISGVFDAGMTINLGGTAAGDLFTNEGLLSPGAFGTVLTTNETGNFVQTATGSCGTFGAPTSTCGYYGIDLDLEHLIADRLNVSGTANVTGAVVVNVDNAGYALPGTSVVTILSAAGGETHPGLELQAFQTAVAMYSLIYPNSTDIDLSYSINFSPAGLTQNEHSVGNAVNAIQTARSSPNFVPIAAALFYQPTVAALGAVYDSLSGEGVAAAEQTAFEANGLFHTSILHQAQYWLFDNEQNDMNSQTFYAPLGYAPSDKNLWDSLVLKAPGAAAPVAATRTWRFWTTASGGGSNYSGDPVVGSAPMSEIGGGLTAGVDYQLSPNLLMGFAAGHGLFSFEVPNRATTGTVDASHVGVYTVARKDDAYAIAMLDFDYFDNSENRTAAIPGAVIPPLFGSPMTTIPGFAEQPGGKFGSYSVSGLFETGYKYHLTGYDVTPLVGVQFSALQMNGFTETNNGNPSMIGLAYASRTIASVPAYIGAQVDAKANLGNSYLLDGWIRAAWVHEFEADRSIDASFIAAPGFGFVVEGAQPARDMARISTGAKLNVSEHVSFSASVDANLAPSGQSYSGFGGFRVSW
jgi:uncharacterized protein with beta-barrel porin domain